MVKSSADETMRVLIPITAVAALLASCSPKEIGARAANIQSWAAEGHATQEAEREMAAWKRGGDGGTMVREGRVPPAAGQAGAAPGADGAAADGTGTDQAAPAPAAPQVIYVVPMQ